MHPAFKPISMCCRGVFNVLREGSNVLRNFIISTLDVLRNTSFFQSAAENPLTTQWGGRGRSTAALLSIKNYYMFYRYNSREYIAYIGRIRERRSKCCAPRQSVSGWAAQ